MEAFSTIKHIKPVEKKKFVAVVFNLKYETFVVYVASLTSFALLILSNSDIHLFCKP